MTKFKDSLEPITTDSLRPTIRFVPEKDILTDGELLVYDGDGKLKFRTKVKHFNPKELGMKHYCFNQSLTVGVPSEHMCEPDQVEVWM